MSTSLFSYAITRKWADVYTVVTWDQRNCGKSYSQKMNDVELSNEIVMSDAMAVIDYLRVRLQKEKITLLGHGEVCSVHVSSLNTLNALKHSSEQDSSST